MEVMNLVKKDRITLDGIDLVPHEMLEEIMNTPKNELILGLWRDLGLNEEIFTKYIAPDLEDFPLGQEIFQNLLGIAVCKKKVEEE